jgi:hypothetical protein
MLTALLTAALPATPTVAQFPGGRLETAKPGGDLWKGDHAGARGRAPA